jgi:hypothetical protein
LKQTRTAGRKGLVFREKYSRLSTPSPLESTGWIWPEFDDGHGVLEIDGLTMHPDVFTMTKCQDVGMGFAHDP